MCCSGDSTVKATETAQAAFTSTLKGAFNTAFASKQADLNTLTSKLTDMINNPHGFDPKTLALMKTGASDTVARQTAQAQTAANTYLATHGGTTLGSGVAAQIKGNIAAAGATEGERESSNIDVQSGLLQNENYWKAISGLSGVAQEENPEGLASSEVGSANSVSDLSKAYQASKFAGLQAFGSIVSGVSGLAKAVAPSFAGSGGGGATSTSTPQMGDGTAEGFSSTPSLGYT